MVGRGGTAVVVALADEGASVVRASVADEAPSIQRAFLKPAPRPAVSGDPVMAAAQGALPQLTRNTGAVGNAAHAVAGAAAHGADFETRNTVTELVTTTTRRLTPRTSLLRKKTLQATGDGGVVPGYMSGKPAFVA